MVSKEMDNIEELERLESILESDNSLLWNTGLESFEAFQLLLESTKTRVIESSVGSLSNS